MVDEKRQEFLLSCQSLYMSMPKDAQAFGRLVDVTKEGFTLLFEGENRDFYWKDISFPYDYTPSEVLNSGDIVVLTEGSLFLFAANKRPQGFLASNKSQLLRSKQKLNRCIRSFFEKKEFIEVTTPYLVATPALEACLDAFCVSGSSTDKQLFLPTSPEIHLKKILAAGNNKIFEISASFRDELSGPLHRPEFSMLEWYRGYSDIDHIEQDLLQLISYLFSEFEINPLEISIKTVGELFKEYIGFQLVPETTSSELAELCDQYGIHRSSSDSWSDLFHRLYLEKIECHFFDFPALIVKNYPPQLCALARVKDDGWTARFELFLGGVEIANAYDELTDPEEHMRRLQRENKDRQEHEKLSYKMDMEFYDCLSGGFPPSGGIAVGLDRLLMFLLGEKNIAEVNFFNSTMLEESQHSY